MTQPLVSVLIPCFNAEKYIADAIQSALDQDYPNIEVIVMDDGSTDASLSVIRRFESDSRFRWETGPNRGGNAARNRLIALASGEFVQFLDADDLLLSNKISSQMAVFSADRDAVLCDYRLLDEANPGLSRDVMLQDCGEDLLEYFIRGSQITMLPLHRRKHLVVVSGFDETLRCCQEYDLHVRLAENVWKKIVRIPEILAHKRAVRHSVSFAERKIYLTWSKLLIESHERLQQRGELTQRRAQAIAEMLYACGRHLVRVGQAKAGRVAFSRALTLSPRADVVVSPAMRLVSNLIGPVSAERLRTVVKRSTSNTFPGK